MGQSDEAEQAPGGQNPMSLTENLSNILLAEEIKDITGNKSITGSVGGSEYRRPGMKFNSGPAGPPCQASAAEVNHRLADVHSLILTSIRQVVFQKLLGKKPGPAAEFENLGGLFKPAPADQLSLGRPLIEDLIVLAGSELVIELSGLRIGKDRHESSALRGTLNPDSRTARSDSAAEVSLQNVAIPKSSDRGRRGSVANGGSHRRDAGVHYKEILDIVRLKEGIDD